jgi:4-hydroxyphenylpyruvate dioxygenase
MKSKVMESSDSIIKFPLIEATSGHRKSQVDEYLEFNDGPGVQHTALASDDIIRTVSLLRNGGIEFVRTPNTYYDELVERVGHVEEELAVLRDLGILVDKDGWGYLMQIFSKPLQARPTFFVEIIQRKGARGFGSGNIKALFEAAELEQLRRGH